MANPAPVGSDVSNTRIIEDRSPKSDQRTTIVEHD